MLKRISIFDKSKVLGCGMPYDVYATDIYSMANIASEEIPALQISFADWLREQDQATLQDLNLDDKEISDSEVYNRRALGQYLCAQYKLLTNNLRAAGFIINEYSATEIVDIAQQGDSVKLKDVEGNDYSTDYLFIATGHAFPNDDKPEFGYYGSPWPIRKILPSSGKYFDFNMGTLGASLSAFDVISSLFHRHGTFTEQGDKLVYTAHNGAENFKITLHDANGWLPHLQYEQKEPMRALYRHVDRQTLLSLLDKQGHLRLAVYFDKVCRPALGQAFREDFKPDMIAKLQDPTFTLMDFVEAMSVRHSYDDPFSGMQQELPAAKNSVENDRPIHWKEVTDDLMYTLNYHAELMPAEDHITFNDIVMPFLMNVIAALPLSSAKIMLALHAAGKLDLKAGNIDDISFENNKTIVRFTDPSGNKKECHYPVFVSCGGQSALEIDDYPFTSLVKDGSVQAARVKFSKPVDEKQPFYFLKGIDVDPGYRVYAKDGQANNHIRDVSSLGKSESKPEAANNHIRDVSFTHTLGLRPYSYGLQACNQTAKLGVESLVMS
ncbi:FAD/NAD(P)-binding protein [Aliiglaciecola sp. LCG003]|uniref:FAD/NAD(P)-binding protein n=1 Tax=Aliiglaciecola sp. LCG003 TaxID=3053655 RepID=UPI002572B1DD|nr:FAD/NAD(P)-binding protein [Aliiglaciecola sp. LCG003]WJG10265.1 FAD/NAD(P)-binding protein [Aliiglaciecola sp. LCG003]